jgi:hypothetical protein
MSLRRLATLAAIWWAVQLALSLPPAIVFWAWLAPRVAYSPATDVLLHGFNAATVSDLLQPEHGGVIRSVWAGAMFAALCSGLLAPLMIAGTLGVLRKASDRRQVGAFIAAAVDPLWPLFAIGVATRGCALLLALLSGAIITFVVTIVGGEFWEPAPFVSFGLSAATGLAIWWVFVAVGDLALVQRTEAPRRSTLTSVASAAALVLRHPVALARRWLMAFVLPAAAVQVLYLVLANRLFSAPAVLFVAQQAVMLVRAGCRVQVLAAERDFLLAWKGRSVRHEDQVRPGQDREREIQQRQEPERPVHAEQVQEHRAPDSEHLGDGEPRTETGVAERVRDERISLGQTERRDAEVRKNPVEGL